MPVLRRVDDVVGGEPVEVAGRVVTPVARRTGWVLGARGWVIFRLAVRPQSVAVAGREHGSTAVVRVRSRQRHLTLAVLTITALLVARIWRRTT